MGEGESGSEDPNSAYEGLENLTEYKLENTTNNTDTPFPENTIDNSNNVNSGPEGSPRMPQGEVVSESNTVQTDGNTPQNSFLATISNTVKDVIEKEHESQATANLTLINSEIVEYDEPQDISHLDIRVGNAIFLCKHPKPSKEIKFMEKIVIGTKKDDPEANEEYNVESGVPNQYKLTQLQNIKLVVLCNIKPVTRRGLENKIAVLCARKGNKTDLLMAPPHTKPGDPIVVDGFIQRTHHNRVANVFQNLGSDFRVNKDKQVEYKGLPLKVKNVEGFITTSKLSNCGVSTVMKHPNI